MSKIKTNINSMIEAMAKNDKESFKASFEEVMKSKYERLQPIYEKKSKQNILKKMLEK